MVRKLLILAPSLAAIALTACMSSPNMRPDAIADLAPASASQVKGTVTFRNTADGVRAEATVSGLTAGEHGFHIHEVGDCSAPDATSAKGHFNPVGKSHGNYAAADHHAGDMPNLVADDSGNAKWSATIPGIRGGSGESNILGRAVVIHADPDDYKSQPAGNSGKRIACGVIKGS